MSPEQQLWAKLHLCDISVMVHLGCTETERKELQEIRFSIQFGFREAPPGEKTDRLEDTICYAEVIEHLSEFLEGKEYNLVESMAADCLSLLRRIYPGVLLQICLHKLYPPLPSLKGGVKYIVGDPFV